VPSRDSTCPTSPEVHPYDDVKMLIGIDLDHMKYSNGTPRLPKGKWTASSRGKETTPTHKIMGKIINP